MEEDLDVDVSLHFYQHYQLISFISITPSLLLEAIYMAHMHAHTQTHTHTQLFIRSAAIGLRSFEIENMIS